MIYIKSSFSSPSNFINNSSNFEFQTFIGKKKKKRGRESESKPRILVPSIDFRRKKSGIKIRGRVCRDRDRFTLRLKKKKKIFENYGRGGKKPHAWRISRDWFSKRYETRGFRNGNEYEIPYAINGYRNGRRKKFHIPGRGCGASGFMNEISFPEKTPPIRGLREADRFILGRIQADQFVPRFARELESPIVTDRLNGLSLSSATNLENRIFHRPHRIVFATFENDMDYDFDSDSMGMVFFVLCLPLRRFSFERWSVFGKRLKNLAIV